MLKIIVYELMRIILSIILFIFVFAAYIHPQEIEPKRISWGISINYTSTEGDLNKHWGNFFSPGILLQYDINDDFLFEASLSGSYLKPLPVYSEDEIPVITLINSQADIKYKFASAGNFVFSVSPGISNTTFIFSGRAADKVETNFIEHEFGFFISPAIGFHLSETLQLALFFCQQLIFSSPDYLYLSSTGIKIILR